MADPTPEELQQQIDELKSLITTEYEPPTGTEYSYPVVNQPVNDEMWQYVTLGLGNGILDEGGEPYWLRGRENVNNTVRITVSTVTNTAQALLRGFYHRLTADKTFTVPPVASTTVYHFCLTYDPTAHTTPGGPISLQMYAGTPPTTLGRFHVVLWTLTRKPNQLLTDAEYVKHRPRVAPSITVARQSDMPKPSAVLWGSICYVHRTNEVFMAVGDASDGDSGVSEWKNLTGPSETYTRPDGVYKWAGSGAKPGAARFGQTVFLEGRAARGDRFDGQNFNEGGTYELMTLPEGMRPSAERRFVTKSDGVGGILRSAIIVVSADGTVNAYPHQSCAWIGLDGCQFTLAR